MNLRFEALKCVPDQKCYFDAIWQCRILLKPFRMGSQTDSNERRSGGVNAACAMALAMSASDADACDRCHGAKGTVLRFLGVTCVTWGGRGALGGCHITPTGGALGSCHVTPTLPTPHPPTSLSTTHQPPYPPNHPPTPYPTFLPYIFPPPGTHHIDT